MLIPRFEVSPAMFRQVANEFLNGKPLKKISELIDVPENHLYYKMKEYVPVVIRERKLEETFEISKKLEVLNMKAYRANLITFIRTAECPADKVAKIECEIKDCDAFINRYDN